MDANVKSSEWKFFRYKSAAKDGGTYLNPLEDIAGVSRVGYELVYEIVP